MVRGRFRRGVNAGAGGRRTRGTPSRPGSSTRGGAPSRGASGLKAHCRDSLPRNAYGLPMALKAATASICRATKCGWSASG